MGVTLPPSLSFLDANPNVHIKGRCLRISGDPAPPSIHSDGPCAFITPSSSGYGARTAIEPLEPRAFNVRRSTSSVQCRSPANSEFMAPGRVHVLLVIADLFSWSSLQPISVKILPSFERLSRAEISPPFFCLRSSLKRSRRYELGPLCRAAHEGC